MLPRMRSLLRLLIVVLVLGSAIQQGWLLAATGFVVERLGGPAAVGDPAPRLDLLALLRRLAAMIGTLPDPWYSLAMMVGGIVGLILAVRVVGGLVRATTRLSGWLRDASV